jgi:anti-anti-sigma factor
VAHQIRRMSAAGSGGPAQPASTPAPLAIMVEHHSHQSVLRLQGELDLISTDGLRDAVSTALGHHPPVLVIDLSGLTFMDCGGLSVLVWAHQSQAERGYQLIVTGATPPVLRLLNLTGLDTYLHLSTPRAPG